MPTQFNSTYDLSWDHDTQVVLFHDIEFESYYHMNFFEFQAFVRSRYSESKHIQDSIINALLNYRDLRITPIKKLAAVKERTVPDFAMITLSVMNDVVNSGANVPILELKEFCMEKYGVDILKFRK